MKEYIEKFCTSRGVTAEYAITLAIVKSVAEFYGIDIEDLKSFI